MTPAMMSPSVNPKRVALENSIELPQYRTLCVVSESVEVQFLKLVSRSPSVWKGSANSSL